MLSLVVFFSRLFWLHFGGGGIDSSPPAVLESILGPSKISKDNDRQRDKHRSPKRSTRDASPHPRRRQGQKKSNDVSLVDQAFDVVKQQTLAKLAAFIDNSKKGGVDAPIEALMHAINAHSDYVTTSSCSGRVAIFAESDGARKQTGVWLLASHEAVDFHTVQNALTKGDTELREDMSTIWLKFEPVIFHIQCRSVEAAKALLNTAISSGMKNSGIMLGKKIMVAVRCSLKIESPIGHEGKILVDDNHLQMLVALTSTMFLENEKRTSRFELAFRDRFCPE